MSNDKWVKGTVAIQIQKRVEVTTIENVNKPFQYVPEEVACIRKGCWAIHKCYSSYFTITHIPSGVALKTLKGQRIAKQLADELTNPGFNTSEGSLPHFAVIEDAKPIIAKYAQYF